jgi:alpha-tubulin suppressor-like RCC1 family protein
MKYIFAVLAVLGLFVLTPVQGQTHMTLAAGGDFFVQIDDTGPWGWGRNHYGQLGLGASTANRPSPQPVALAPTQSGNAASLCAGDSFSCVLDDENNLACTGSDSWGEQGVGVGTVIRYTLGMPTGVSSIDHIGCGYSQVLATTTTGALMVWGSNSHGQLGLAGPLGEVWEAQVSICPSLRVLVSWVIGNGPATDV